MRKRGFLLITALLIIIILMLIGMGFLGSQAARYRAALRSAESSQARQLALAGLEDARIKMELDENFPPKGALNQDTFSYSEKLTITSIPPVNGTYTVIINATYANDPAAVLFITSIGTIGEPESPISQYRLKAELDFRDSTAAPSYDTYGPARAGGPAAINATRFFRYTHIQDEETPDLWAGARLAPARIDGTMYTETTLATLTWDELCRAFRRVYEGYMVTLQIDSEWMQSHVERNSIVLRESPLWLDASGDVVGLALLGVRPPRGWVGGFGLSPQYRGQGLAGHILDAIMTRAEDLGLTTLQLEVLQNNHKAYRVYANFDFEPVRKVETLTCPLFYPEIPLEGAMFAPWERAKGLPYRQDLVWQREAPWAPREGGQLIVYGTEWVCFRLQRNKILLLDASAREPAGLEALLTDLRHRYPKPPIVLANEAVGSPLYRQLTALHWQESLPQWEMRCTLET